MTERSNGYTYILRYEDRPTGPVCATRTGLGRSIDLQLRVPELIDVQGWILKQTNQRNYRILDPTIYYGTGSKEYGISEPLELAAVSLGKPSEFKFTPDKDEPTKYLIELSGTNRGYYKCLGVLNDQLVITQLPDTHPWKALPHWYLDRISG